MTAASSVSAAAALESARCGESVVAFLTLPETLELVEKGADVEPLTDWARLGDGPEWAWVTVSCAAA